MHANILLILQYVATVLKSFCVLKMKFLTNYTHILYIQVRFVLQSLILVRCIKMIDTVS